MTMLEPLTILLTAAGSPGASTCIRYLRGVSEREVRVVGLDANPEASGRFSADVFYTVPLASDPGYIDALIKVALREKARVLIPASSFDIEVVAPHASWFEDAGVKVLCSSPDVLSVANNKHRLYTALKNDERVKVPQFILADSLEAFLEAVRSLGYPEKGVCFKPPYSKGSRGFRYLSSNLSRRDLLMNQKPGSTLISLEEFQDIFCDEPDFPELLVMETVEGEEIDTMVVGWEGQALLITHKTRERERGGVITQGELVTREALDVTVRAIVEQVPLTYNFGIQFKGGYLIEINPRLSTFIYDNDFVEPYLAVKLALGELNPGQVAAYQDHVPLGRRMVRYFDQVFF